MHGKPLDERLIGQLRERISMGFDMSESVLELREMGYSDRTILAGLEAARPRGNALANGAMQALPLLRRAPPNLRRVESAKFPLYTLEEFLSPKQCADIVSLVAQHLRPSTVAYESYDNAYRTSSTADLCRLKDPLALDLDAMICRTLGIRAEYSEGIQAQRYDVGQEFKPHFDWFEPGTNAYERYAGMRGNRTWTFMVYLNEDLEGGATRFTEIDLAIAPKTGMALFWNNLHADGTPDRATMHCGEPVTRGHKVIITKWFRVHGDGPVFYA